ncbi:unnamed protein product [Didymodactylos carnosus]|uniref:Eukaryotic translation initiation factor 3 30 kDa subunit n=1 Tax=Didymodactylos carnosus TaxID=1234261 RepID=A0A813NZ61_9BILA|nr:unnamed protein product [Didymodactylos carnosus]CAF0745855.1 unnamed protein product [Didymodactylos carnosus]CAF3506073.1 unnamed protein product [Didymodactylos carnosus]CAF3524597.1 unnamed protein product [Didymodactylos carnosus]
MSEWQAPVGGQIFKGDIDDIPDDWEADLEEKPKKPEINTETTQKSTATTTKNKTKKKQIAGDSDDDLVREPERIYTADELAEISKRNELSREESKLKMVNEFVSGGDKYSLDDTNLLTKEDFTNYSFRLYNRLNLLAKSEHYLDFLDKLLFGLSEPLSIDQTRHLTTTLQGIQSKKLSEDRERKFKLKKNKVAKPQLRAERTELELYGGDGVVVGGDDDDDIDFM